MSDLTIGRYVVRETWSVSETGAGVLQVAGREVMPPLTRADVVYRYESALGSQRLLVPVVWEDKPERSGYYTVTSASGDIMDRAAEGVVVAEWKLSLARHGSDTDVDLESRLTGAVRANDFSLTGERWHAPPIGHHSYYTGSTIPSTMTRTGSDGAVTVYRGVPANVSPRWGCAVDDYLRGCVRILSVGYERVGVGQAVDADDWELSNTLVRVRPLLSGGTLEIAAYTGGAWRTKAWWADIGGVQIARFEAATILRNDPEMCVLRLTEHRATVGRAVLDLTLRRGSRVVEGYLQRGDSGTLSVYLASAETMTDSTSYVVKTTNDADGNRAIAGSARNFDPHASGGITKTASTALDFFVGVVAGGGSAVSGDQATNIRDQYIGALPEAVVAVRR
ncbi:hypothetical protein [Nonomuraea basaltis]|uniref:hypothetical protein n=1 Tax=Nonomuraea basaltis TaxID=2495887 RepID=UPI00110C6EB6|nr:hypothetical protein [Nonomuraea basaltis]TMS00194.1 hypothetical protein EJK15_03725 [Nonomuraea basaltis]